MKVTVAEILRILEADGPMTATDLWRYFPGSHRRSVTRTIHSLRRTKDQRVYIKSYVREDMLGAKRHIRAVYALGCRPDAPRPKPIHTNITSKARREKLKAVKTLGRGVANSVWALGA